MKTEKKAIKKAPVAKKVATKASDKTATKKATVTTDKPVKKVTKVATKVFANQVKTKFGTFKLVNGLVFQVEPFPKDVAKAAGNKSAQEIFNSIITEVK